VAPSSPRPPAAINTKPQSTRPRSVPARRTRESGSVAQPAPRRRRRWQRLCGVGPVGVPAVAPSSPRPPAAINTKPQSAPDAPAPAPVPDNRDGFDGPGCAHSSGHLGERQLVSVEEGERSGTCSTRTRPSRNTRSRSLGTFRVSWPPWTRLASPRRAAARVGGRGRTPRTCVERGPPPALSARPARHELPLAEVTTRMSATRPVKPVTVVWNLLNAHAPPPALSARPARARARREQTAAWY
jgi:hypothetical protein